MEDDSDVLSPERIFQIMLCEVTIILVPGEIILYYKMEWHYLRYYEDMLQEFGW